jgi:ABC-2 type transport system permease protein
VQGAFPLLFVLLFFSSAFFPRELMTGAYKRIADINPISHLVEGMRTLVLDGFDTQALAKTLFIPMAICVVAVTLALTQLRRRINAQ